MRRLGLVVFWLTQVGLKLVEASRFVRIHASVPLARKHQLLPKLVEASRPKLVEAPRFVLIHASVPLATAIIILQYRGDEIQNRRSAGVLLRNIHMC